MISIKKAALVGAGAVGAYFIWGLSEKMGDDFCVVASGERKNRLQKEGLMINEKQYTFNVKTAEEAGIQDLILVSCKSDALLELLPDIKKMTGPDTFVLSLLNGVSSEEIIGKAIGMEHMAYAVMRIASVREGNKITFSEENTAVSFQRTNSVNIVFSLMLSSISSSTAVPVHSSQELLLQALNALKQRSAILNSLLRIPVSGATASA